MRNSYLFTRREERTSFTLQGGKILLKRLKTNIVLWILLLSFSVTAQPENLAVGNFQTIGIHNFSPVTDLIVPVEGALELTVRGGDGGTGRTKHFQFFPTLRQTFCTSPGGAGATVSATFVIGTGTGQIPPGTVLRFLLGEQGGTRENSLVIPVPLLDIAAYTSGGGGGGAAAVLARFPDSASFVPLVIAGGGGGGYVSQYGHSCIVSNPGGNGKAGRDGSSGGGFAYAGAGGTDGNGGGGDPVFGPDSGAGGGLLSDGVGAFCLEILGGFEAYKGFMASDTGTYDMDSGGCLILPNPVRKAKGGGGYIGGGSGAVTGGGGGGYSGGGKGGSDGGGGGGGSFVSPYAVHSFAGDGSEPIPLSHSPISYLLIPDNNTPTAACNFVIVEANENCEGEVEAAEFGVTSNDPDGDELTFSASPAGPYALGTTLVTLTVSDGEAASSCTATLIVFKEATCAPPFSINLDEEGVAAISTADIDTGGSANCNTHSLALDISTFGCDNLGDNVVTLTVTDGAGSISTCTTLVTVSDVISPTITCPNNPGQVNDLDECFATVNLTAPVITDSCSSTTGVFSSPGIIISDADQAVATAQLPLGITPVTFTATDAAGNQSSCSFNFIVIDDEGPRFENCPETPIIVSAETGSCGAFVDYEDIVLIDNCPGVTEISFSHDPTGDYFPVGTTHVGLVGSGREGLTVFCDFQVTVVDESAPVVTCTPASIVLDANGTGTLATSQVFAGVSDNCFEAAEPILSRTTFSCTDVGDQVVTVSVTDVNGNIGSCTATVTVVDNEAPLFPTCPRDPIVVSAAADGCGAFVDFDDIIIVDNCFGATITSFSHNVAGDDFDLGTTTVTITGSDAAGNGSVCSFEVTVVDDVAPQAFCIPATVSLDANGQGALTIDQVLGDATDNCGLSNTTPTLSNNSFSCADIGSQSVTVTITDVNGNTGSCVATVTVTDPIAPALACQDATIELDSTTGMATLTTTDVTASVNDACGIQTLELGRTAFDCSATTSNNVVTLTATDNNGNPSTCTATVTVVDVTAPTVVCQTTTVELSSDGVAVLTAATLDGGSTDACGIVDLAISQTDFACADVGTEAVTLMATDAAGLSASCTVEVMVIESTNPVAGCKDISIDLDASGNASILAAQINDGSTDACGLAQLSVNIDQFDCDDTGDNDVVLTITNSNGNTSTCTAIVTVNDVTAPEAVCKDITRPLDAATGTVSIEQWDVNNGSYDACRIVQFDLSLASFDCSNVGNNVITLTITDASGLQDVCTANVMILDETPPTLFCQDMTVTLSADLGRASITAGDVTFNVSDACGIEGTSIDVANFDCADLGANIVTLTANDVNGNSTSCAATVTVEDNSTPTVDCRDVTITVDTNGNATLTPNQVDGGSFDNCNFNLSLSQTNFGYADYPATSVTLTGTDEAGNAASCTANVTVIVPCDNVTDGGSIGESETGCGSFAPAPINSLAPASGGGNAPIEYLWLSTTNPNLPMMQWQTVGTDETFASGTIDQTTYYLRSARRLGCEIYEAESNVISKIVNNQGEACAPGDETVLLSGDAVAYFNNTWVSHPANLLGPVDGESALFYDYNDNIRIQLPDELPAGSQVTITWKRRNYGGHSPARLMVYENTNSGNGSQLNDILYTQTRTFHISSVITLQRDGVNSLWLRNKPGYADFEIDAITYCATRCVSEPVYCTPEAANTEYEFIDRVKVGSINNWSGDDGGYGDYTNLSTNLSKGHSCSISLTPGFYGSSYIEYWKVYIDFDQDGEFESHEQVYRGRGRGEKRSNIYIPTWAHSGETRMRVIMKYGGYGYPCSDGFGGEMEDYTVHVNGNNSFADGNEPANDSKVTVPAEDTDKDLDVSVITDRSDAEIPATEADMKVYPNPTNGPITVSLSRFGEQDVEVTITNQLGQVIIRKTLAPGTQQLTLDAVSDNLIPGFYLVLANDGKQRLARQLIVVK